MASLTTRKASTVERHFRQRWRIECEFVSRGCAKQCRRGIEPHDSITPLDSIEEFKIERNSYGAQLAEPAEA